MNEPSKLECLSLGSLFALVYFFLVRSRVGIYKTTYELLTILVLVCLPYLKMGHDFLGETYNGTIVIVKISEVVVNINSGTVLTMLHFLHNLLMNLVSYIDCSCQALLA
jgi:hypothetical protein